MSKNYLNKNREHYFVKREKLYRIIQNIVPKKFILITQFEIEKHVETYAHMQKYERIQKKKGIIL